MEIQIVEYQPKYAAGLADMWNKSGEGWGGLERVQTKESVLQEHEGSENIKTWLALDGNTVVGYCGFSEYREDEGASYIPLLNVRPDYYGKKVGKLLVLKAVEAACQSQWPRLDLYTWPGNTKAVPLYKKCGFFWEDRDDSTHLMNFIPYVMQTEAVADFFQVADWYADSSREIIVEPDGRRENGFDYYQYQWQHGKNKLRMEFERRGRGLRLIETDDWLVEAWIEDINLVFGRSYTASYRLVNKTGKPLRVAIHGRDDENISFALERTLDIQGETVVQAQFQVGKIEEEQNIWRTHPGVCAQIIINGKKAQFKVGLVPKFPALIKAILPETECFPGSQGRFYLNMENGFNESATFKFTLPQAPCLELKQRDYQVTLAGGEKKAVPVPYTLRELGLWTDEVTIFAKPQSGRTVEYKLRLTLAFASSGTCLCAEDSTRWFAVNGRYILSLDKSDNFLVASPLNMEPYYCFFSQPKVGLPFSLEFAKTRPIQVKQFVEHGVAIIKATYRSKARPGLEFERCASLQADGLVRQSWSLKNIGTECIGKLCFRVSLRHPLEEAVLPLAGKILDARNGYGEYIDNYDLSQLSENWVFSRAGIGRGLSWPKDTKPIAAHGQFTFNYELGDLEPGQEREIEPIILSLGTYRNWQDFRRFALGNCAAEVFATDSTEVQANGGNPFVDKEYLLSLQEHKNVPFAGEVRVESGIFASRTASLADSQASITLPNPAPGTVDLVKVEASTNAILLRRQAALFGVGGQVDNLRQERDGLEVITVDNGCLRFSAARDFGPVLFSLEYQGQEWLDSAYPHPCAKSWWNPWHGGACLEIDDLSSRSLLQAPRTVQFATRQDNVGNKWQGIEIQVDVQEHERFKGLKFSHLILTLPGFAGVCMYFEIKHSGLVRLNEYFINQVFLAPGGTVGSSWCETVSPQGETIRYKLGGGVSPRTKKLLFASSDCAERLLTFSNVDTKVNANNEVMAYVGLDRLNLEPDRKTTQPQFFFFVKEDIPTKALEPLKKIHFAPKH